MRNRWYGALLVVFHVLGLQNKLETIVSKNVKIHF